MSSWKRCAEGAPGGAGRTGMVESVVRQANMQVEKNASARRHCEN